MNAHLLAPYIHQDPDHVAYLKELCGLSPRYNTRIEFWLKDENSNSKNDNLALDRLVSALKAQNVTRLILVKDGKDFYAKAVGHTLPTLADFDRHTKLVCIEKIHSFATRMMDAKELPEPAEALPAEEKSSSGPGFEQARLYREKVFANSPPEYLHRFKAWDGSAHSITIAAVNVIFEYMRERDKTENIAAIQDPRALCDYIVGHLIEEAKDGDRKTKQYAKMLGTTVKKVFCEVIAPESYTPLEHSRIMTKYGQKPQTPAP